MVFSSTVFLFLFLPVTLIIYYNPIIKSRKFKNYFLLLASLIFYGYGEPLFIFLMLFSIFVNYCLGLKVAKSNNRKMYVTFAYIFNLSILFIFKYLAFTLDNINYLFNTNFFVKITLPIGISFFTFQILSYVIDVYRKPESVQKNILNVALYISLFPQLIAGPIVRYETVADELTNRVENFSDFSSGIQRFVIGLGKKVLISNYVGLIADNIFYNMSVESISTMTAWIGAIAYTLQIYFDFSGYSDMAIGLGRMFGFHFNENFNYPYIASSITDFWRRWHISLSTWFRDYVYIPLGGNRVSNIRHILNLFIVWLFTGLWHGANWTFIVWGLFYFVLLLLEKKTNIIKKLGHLSYVYTLFFVIIGWIIFRSDNLLIAINYIGKMLGIGTCLFDRMALEYIKVTGLIIPIGIVLSTPLLKNIWNKLKININIKEVVKVFTIILIFIFSILTCISSTYNPFIYFNF